MPRSWPDFLEEDAWMATALDDSLAHTSRSAAELREHAAALRRRAASPGAFGGRETLLAAAERCEAAAARQPVS